MSLCNSVVFDVEPCPIPQDAVLGLSSALSREELSSTIESAFLSLFAVRSDCTKHAGQLRSMPHLLVMWVNSPPRRPRLDC